MTPAKPIGERSCGACTLCCKLLGIPELSKPKDRWCPHCQTGRGCKIYVDRPNVCRDFFCQYLQAPLGTHWQPETAKMVVAADQEGARIAVHVDPGRPLAWRAEPFYADLKRWAQTAVAEMNQVVVTIGKRVIVILPDRDVDLGPVADDERIALFKFSSSAGPRWEAMKLKADDPRLQGMKPGEVAHRKIE